MKTLGAMCSLFAVTMVVAGPNTAVGQAPINENLPLYRPADQMTGQITLVGSNTMAQLAGNWVDSFRQFHPNVKIDVQIKGSRSAVTAVMDGTATFGLLSRTIEKEEIEAFEKRFGYQPKVLTPSLERIAVMVHKDNPVQELTLAQLTSIFGRDANVRTWGDVGATGEWAKRPIAIQGRGATTGSTSYFQTLVLRGENFDDGMTAHADNSDLVAAVAKNPDAIGYAGLIYQTLDVRVVPIAARSGLPAIAIDGIEADQGQYPLMRPLQLVINQEPGKELPKVQAEFLQYIFSRLGQEDVIKGGFQQIPGTNARFALGQVGLRELN